MYVLLPSFFFCVGLHLTLLSPRAEASVTADLLPRNALSSEDDTKTKAFFTSVTFLNPSTSPQPNKTQWLQLLKTFSNSTFCAHSVFMCFVWI